MQHLKDQLEALQAGLEDLKSANKEAWTLQNLKRYMTSIWMKNKGYLHEIGSFFITKLLHWHKRTNHSHTLSWEVLCTNYLGRSNLKWEECQFDSNISTCYCLENNQGYQTAWCWSHWTSPLKVQRAEQGIPNESYLWGLWTYLITTG